MSSALNAMREFATSAESKLSGSSTEEKLAWLEQEDTATFQHLLAVRSYRNSVVPVNRVPNEILIRIFFILALDALNDPNWFQLTHVCRRWREVAIGESRLWTVIGVDNLSRAYAYLERSSSLPVSLGYRSRPDILPIEDIMGFLSACSERIYCLSLKVTQRNGQHIIDHSPSFPQLRSLEFKGTMGRGDLVAAPDCSLRHSFGSLETLILNKLMIDLSSPIYAGLQKLVLGYHSDWQSPTMDEFLDFLQKYAQLRYLALVCSGLVSDIAASQPRCLVELSHLQEINLNIFPPTAAKLLSHLIIPKDALIKFDCDWRSIRDDESVAGTDRLWFFPKDHDNIDALKRADQVSFVWAKNFRCCTIKSISKGVNQTNIEINTHVDNVGDVWVREILRSALQKLGLMFSQSPVRRFNVVCKMYPFRSIDWHIVLSALSGLRRLELEFQDVANTHPIGNVLRALQEPREPGEESLLLLPDLEELGIRDLKIHEDLPIELHDCLRLRAEKGTRLKRLVLQQHKWMGEGELTWPDFEPFVDEFCIGDLPIKDSSVESEDRALKGEQPEYLPGTRMTSSPSPL